MPYNGSTGEKGAKKHIARHICEVLNVTFTIHSRVVKVELKTKLYFFPDVSHWEDFPSVL